MTENEIINNRRIIFIVLLVLTIPSILCSMYIFYFFIKSPELRQRINNHVILALLIITFIQVVGELPLSLVYLQTGSAAIASDGFCQFWIIFNYITVTGSIWTMAVANIRRYFLIFHRPLIDRYQIWFHYLPLFCCVMYPLILYNCLVFKYTCTNIYDYTQWTCGGPCYLYEPILGTLDWVINGCFDVLLSLLVTATVILRVIFQRNRINSQRSVWRRSRRMILQLIPLSMLFLLVWLPCVISFVIPLFTPNTFLTELYSNYLSYYQYISSLLCPFACLISLPEVRPKLQRFQRIQPRATQQMPARMQNFSRRLGTHLDS